MTSETRREIAQLLAGYCHEAEQEADANGDPEGARLARVEQRAAERFGSGANLSHGLKLACRDQADTWEYEQGVTIPKSLYLS